MPTPKRRKPGAGDANRAPAAVPAAEPFLQADLTAWAGEQVAHAGRNYALLGRVLALRVSPDGEVVEARVRGNRAVPYGVVVRMDDGVLIGECTCSQDGATSCRHAVAALEALRFPLVAARAERGAGRRGASGRRARGQGRIIQKARPAPGFVVLGGEDRTLTKLERIELAREAETRERRHRSRSERMSVHILPSDGLPPRFRVGRRSSGPYLVTLRGAKADRGSCTCPDFAQSELGSCKHVERARRWYLRKKKVIPRDVLSLWWSPRAWIAQAPRVVREVRVDVPAGAAVPADLAARVDAEGWLRDAPSTVTPVDWLAETVEIARSAAVSGGWTFDLDPNVESRVADLAVDVARNERLSRLDDRDLAHVRERLGFRLHPYQDDGLRFLARRGRAFLADDMGLGKTVQAIAAALVLREAVGAPRCLVVCPASLKYQWQSEIRKACGENATVVEGRRTSRAAGYEAWTGGFMVLNYELVLRDLELLQACAPDVVILDEAQRIKNWDTKTAKAVKRLHSPFAFVLTGTPLENRLSELHSLVEFLHPRALGPRWRLLPYHAVSDPTGRVVGYEDLQVLRRRLRPFFLRRERAAVLDQLPDKTDNTFWTEMTPAQARPYRRFASRVAKILASGHALGPAEVRGLLQALTSMRVLCNGLAQHHWERFEDVVRGPVGDDGPDLKALRSPKIEEFVDVLEDILDHSESKIVVFSQWERMLQIARYAMTDLLRRRGERTGIFHGGLDARSRNRLLEEFGRDPDFRVLLSTDAGGLGLNLQDAASVVVHLEVPWNPAILEQRIARVHRLGQKRSVQVLHFVTRGAIEERVRKVVESKRALFEGLLVEEVDRVSFGEAGSAGFVEQVRSLLAGDPEEAAG